MDEHYVYLANRVNSVGRNEIATRKFIVESESIRIL